MPRTYVKKGKSNSWTTAQLKAAMKAVEGGELTVRGAAARFGIPKSTLHDHVRGTHPRVHSGAPTVLTTEEEKEIERACVALQDMGFPLTKEFVSIVIRDFLKERGRNVQFKGGIPGYDWWLGFFRRHPKLVQRKPEHLPKCRAAAAQPEVRDYS